MFEQRRYKSISRLITLLSLFVLTVEAFPQTEPAKDHDPAGKDGDGKQVSVENTQGKNSASDTPAAQNAHSNNQDTSPPSKHEPGAKTEGSGASGAKVPGKNSVSASKGGKSVDDKPSEPTKVDPPTPPSEPSDSKPTEPVKSPNNPSDKPPEAKPDPAKPPTTPPATKPDSPADTPGGEKPPVTPAPAKPDEPGNPPDKPPKPDDSKPSKPDEPPKPDDPKPHKPEDGPETGKPPAQPPPSPPKTPPPSSEPSPAPSPKDNPDDFLIQQQSNTPGNSSPGNSDPSSSGQPQASEQVQRVRLNNGQETDIPVPAGANPSTVIPPDSTPLGPPRLGSPPNNSNSSSSVSSTGAIAGGVIGGLVVGVLVGLFLYRKKKSSKTNRYDSESNRFKEFENEWGLTGSYFQSPSDVTAPAPNTFDRSPRLSMPVSPVVPGASATVFRKNSQNSMLPCYQSDLHEYVDWSGGAVAPSEITSVPPAPLFSRSSILPDDSVSMVNFQQEPKNNTARKSVSERTTIVSPKISERTTIVSPQKGSDTRTTIFVGKSKQQQNSESFSAGESSHTEDQKSIYM